MTDREKLIELIGKVQDEGMDYSDVVCAYRTSNERLADYLLSNGVTFATDNNVGSEWISVTERLPEDDLPKDSNVKQIKVFVAYKTNGRWVTRTQIRAKGYFWGDKDRWSWVKVSDPITHWMPLPEPPKYDL